MLRGGFSNTHIHMRMTLNCLLLSIPDGNVSSQPLPAFVYNGKVKVQVLISSHVVLITRLLPHRTIYKIKYLTTLIIRHVAMDVNVCIWVEYPAVHIVRERIYEQTYDEAKDLCYRNITKIRVIINMFLFCLFVSLLSFFPNLFLSKLSARN